jgi:tetratricopeptide (TPR) repeat protein
MKTPLLLSAIILLLSCLVSGQVSTRTGQQGESQNSAASKLDLAEAERLNASLIPLYNEYKWEEAFPIAKRLLEIRQRHLPADDGLVVAALINLAEIQRARGKNPDAQALFEKALEAVERTSGANDLNVAKLLDRLAVVNYANGNPGKTESYYKRALDIREKTLGPEHEEFARSIYSLAEFYQAEGQFQEAEPLYKNSLAIREKNKAAPDLIEEVMDRYACVLRKTGREAEASELEDRRREMFSPTGVKQAPVSGDVLNGRALRLVTPSYPITARSGFESGEVRVKILIDESGNVIRACAIKGPRGLMRVSELAAYQSKFTSTKLKGKPVKVGGVIVYKFHGR